MVSVVGRSLSVRPLGDRDVSVTVETQERFEGFDDDADNAIGTQVTCFTITQVQRLTQSSMWPQG